MLRLGEHFAGKDQGHHSEWLRQQRWFTKAREDNQRREKAQDRLEDDVVALASEAIMASSAQIKAFEVKLDRYDEATVKALMENQDLLDAVNGRIDTMLSQAHVMEDGRRAFKTEDGTRVFDEFGDQIGVDELHPDQIDPMLPTWEAFSAETDQRDDLLMQRTEILEYQEKLDDARDQIADGDISEADLEALDADLLEMLPDAVRTHLPELEPEADAPAVAERSATLDGTPLTQVQSAVVTAAAPTPFS